MVGLEVAGHRGLDDVGRETVHHVGRDSGFDQETAKRGPLVRSLRPTRKARSGRPVTIFAIACCQDQREAYFRPC